MNIMKFTASNTHEAMLEIRSVLGREAIIVANRKTDDGVEILATDSLEDVEALTNSSGKQTETVKRAATRAKTTAAKSGAKSKKKPASRTADKPQKTDTGKGKRSTVTLESVESDEPDDLESQREVADLRGALEGLARSGALTNTTNIAEIALVGRLTGTGLGPSMVQQLVQQVRPVTHVDTAWQKSLKNLKKQIRFKPGAFTTEGGTFVFHGPSGVGKTSVICKLAMQFLTDNTPAKLAIVSSGEEASLGRKGGLLSAFSQLLQVPIHHAESPDELAHVLRELRRKKLILVDAPAIDTNHLMASNSPIDKLQSKRQIEHCLVVSASMQGSSLDHIFGCLAETTIESVILTRVDETRQIGIATDCLLRSGMQLRYCSDTPDLHSPLHSETSDVLMTRLADLNPTQMPATGSSLMKNDLGPVANWLESAILV